MATYRQYCPVATASEILAERWNPLIVRNMMFGADTFSAIANGVSLFEALGQAQRITGVSTRAANSAVKFVDLVNKWRSLAGVLDAGQAGGGQASGGGVREEASTVEGELGEAMGDHTPLVDRGEQVGWALRSRARCAPGYVSTGHRVSLDTALGWALRLIDGRRILPPIRLAHDAANAARIAAI